MTSIKKINDTGGSIDFSHENNILASESLKVNPIQTIIVDQKGKIAAFNVNNLSVNGDPSIGMVMFKDYYSNHEIDMQNELEKCISSDTVEEYVEHRANGTVHLITISSIKKGAIITIQDITWRKEAETIISEGEEKYRTLFENIHTGVCRTTGGPYGSFIYANPAMAKMLGYTSVEELIKKRVSELYQNPGDRKKFVDRLTKVGTVKGKELRLKKKGGTSITASVTAKAYYDDNNEIKWIDILIDDITKKKKAEKRLKQSYRSLRKTLSNTVQAMAMAIESRDPYTAGHQRRVADLAESIAQEMSLSSNLKDGLRLAGLIHDLGKITIPAEILSKPSLLTEIEFELIKNHCQIGYDILKSIEFPWPVATIVFQHHERIDGSGYPDGLLDDDILIESKILALSDVVEAMATNRPYRARLGVREALVEIQENRGVLYNPDVVNACLRLFNNKGFTFVE